jgi:predicted alpha/beta superfamily hydrolase
MRCGPGDETAAQRHALPKLSGHRLHHPAVQTHWLRSRHVDQLFKMQVMLPAVDADETTRFPVVYATDGNFAFEALKGISTSIQTYPRDAPRFILVSIGYPSDSPVAGYMLRARDMTFPGYPEFSTEPLPLKDVLVAPVGSKPSGGADDFHRFIGDELIPLIDSRFPTVPGDRTYYGHSLGGGFGLYTLFVRAELFSRYIISSPTVAYHGQSSAGIVYDHYEFGLQRARDFIAAGRPLEDTHMYVSVGGREELEAEYSPWQFVTNVNRLTALLKSAAIPRLRLTTELFIDESHMTVWPFAFIHGIQAVFGTRDRNQVAAQ